MLDLPYCRPKWTKDMFHVGQLAFGLGVVRYHYPGKMRAPKSYAQSIGSKLSLELPTLELVGKRRTKPSTQLSALVK